jgi:hypothetical protein
LDFSTYHCCWFVYKNDVLKSDLDELPALAQWMQRMAAFGHCEPTTISGDAAVEIALNSQPAATPVTSETSEPRFAIGDTVEVLPIDYGFQPTRGELLLASMDELIVQRTDPRAGDVAVHFPRLGFRVAAVS